MLKDQKVARLEADILLKDWKIAHLKQKILLDNDNFQEQESALSLEDERLLCQERKIPELKFGERPTQGIELKSLEASEASEDDSTCRWFAKNGNLRATCHGSKKKGANLVQKIEQEIRCCN